jgi:hypothetical protein
MKTIKNMKKFVILFAVIALVGCDEVDELTQIDFDTDITEEITVNLTEDNTSFTGNIMINLADNSDIEDYLSNIEDIEITEASYIIKNYVGEELATGTITATAASQNFGPYNHTFFTDAQNGTVFPFNDVNKLNTVANTLQSTNQLNVQLSGTQDPAQNGSFVIEVTFKLNVTAQAL